MNLYQGVTECKLHQGRGWLCLIIRHVTSAQYITSAQFGGPILYMSLEPTQLGLVLKLMLYSRIPYLPSSRNKGKPLAIGISLSFS
jgi:hypothetical protein